MNLYFPCPTCRSEVYADERLVGAAVVCPNCTATIVVPTHEPARAADELPPRTPGEWRPIQPSNRSGWKLVSQGLRLELAATRSFIAVLLLFLWFTVIPARGSTFPSPAASELIRLILIGGVSMLTLVLAITARVRGSAAPDQSVRNSYLGSALSLTITLFGFPLLLLWPPERNPVGLLPLACVLFPTVAGFLLAELLFVLSLRGVALRFGDAELAQRVILYFFAAVVGLTGVFLVSYFGLLFLGMILRRGAFDWNGMVGLCAAWVMLVWRTRLIRRTRQIILDELHRETEYYPGNDDSPVGRLS